MAAWVEAVAGGKDGGVLPSPPPLVSRPRTGDFTIPGIGAEPSVVVANPWCPHGLRLGVGGVKPCYACLQGSESVFQTCQGMVSGELGAPLPRLPFWLLQASVYHCTQHCVRELRGYRWRYSCSGRNRITTMAYTIITQNTVTALGRETLGGYTVHVGRRVGGKALVRDTVHVGRRVRGTVWLHYLLLLGEEYGVCEVTIIL